MKRLLITGYPGWLTTRFLETWHEYKTEYDVIRCLTFPGMSAQLPDLSVVDEIVEGDLRHPHTLTEVCNDVDAVLHTAGVLHVKKISDFYAVNHGGTVNLVNASVEKGVQKFMYISTNAAQGFCAGRGHELRESDACNPLSHYGKSKWGAEVDLKRFQSESKIQTVVIRPAMFYGPPIPPRHLGIFKKVQKGYFPVFGDGNYLRSLSYIDNLVQGIQLALHSEKANGQTYYITDDVIPTLKEIIEAMAEAMDCKVRLIYLPAFLTDVAHSLDEVISACGRYWMLPHIVGESTKNIACTIQKAKDELGYEPKVTYKEGYRKTIEWCRQKGYLQ